MLYVTVISDIIIRAVALLANWRSVLIYVTFTLYFQLYIQYDPGQVLNVNQNYLSSSQMVQRPGPVQSNVVPTITPSSSFYSGSAGKPRLCLARFCKNRYILKTWNCPCIMVRFEVLTEDGCLLECSTVLSGRYWPTFQMSLLSPSFGWSSSETLISIYQTRQCHIPEDSRRHSV
jgi:hypothetical protein